MINPPKITMSIPSSGSAMISDMVDTMTEVTRSPSGAGKRHEDVSSSHWHAELRTPKLTLTHADSVRVSEHLPSS